MATAAKKVQVLQPIPSNIIDNGDSIQMVKKRVCAYCRVSTDSEEQMTSYEAQVDEYRKKITGNPDWEMVDIYADAGISGTNIKHWTAFNRMIRDCKNGKIDLIITKSISRFDRNTVDCLEHVRKLKAIGVEVFFEKDYTLYDKSPYISTIFTTYTDNLSLVCRLNLLNNTQRCL